MDIRKLGATVEEVGEYMHPLIQHAQVAGDAGFAIGLLAATRAKWDYTKTPTKGTA